jgi:hypothetical protein
MDQERPIVRIRPGEQDKRLKGKRIARRRPVLTPSQQTYRLAKTLDRRLDDAIAGKKIDVTTDPSGLATERALVLEIAGEIGNFANAAERIGLEWLAEEITRVELDVQMAAVLRKPDDEEDGDYDYFEEDVLETFLDEEVEKPTVSGRLYFGMPTIKAFKELQKLWKKFKREEPAPKGYTDWWQLFGLLKDLRGWGPEDRISPETRQTLAEVLEENPRARVKVEVDLWYRGDDDDRQSAFEQFVARLNEISGELLDDAAIDEIRYHAALISLPASQVRKLTTLSSDLAFADEIMSITPQNVLSGKPSTVDAAAAPRRARAPAEPDGRPPIVALLDGYPVDSHDLLMNRISITEVDVESRQVPLGQRCHGTAMASLILHGDIAAGGQPLDRTLKVVPILGSGQGAGEISPADKLPIAMIFRAVERLKGKTRRASAAPDVLIINHSLGVEGVPFAQSMSPWARMLDYLAYTKRILFIVSAGNIPEPFEIEGYTDLSSFRNAPPPKRQKDIVMGLDGSKARRGMLTPAEQINGLTVAATHADASQVTLPANAVDPYDRPLPNLCSGMGLGFRRSVKPDISAPGGRMVAQPTIGTPFTVHGHNAGQYGQLAACPDDHGALVDRVRRCVGTSNAAALTTRAAVQIADALDFSLRDEPIQWRDRPTSAVMLKALVAHSARWGQAGAYLEGVLPPGGWKQWRPRRENVTRHIGYGGIDPDLVMSGTDHRITLLGEGEIRKEQRHPYFVPLPQELSAKRDFRRIIVTLAWMTPVKASSQHYRMVGLELVPEVRGQPFWPGIKRIGRIQPPGHMGREGTLIHSIYEGEEAQPILASSGITFNVQAWSRISGVSKIDIPYAIAITVEVADTLNADIYNSVRNRLRPRLRPRL